MAERDRLDVIIRAQLAGQPCMLPDLTRDTVPPGCDVAGMTAAEARAADLAGLVRLLAESCGTGADLAAAARSFMPDGSEEGDEDAR